MKSFWGFFFICFGIAVVCAIFGWTKVVDDEMTVKFTRIVSGIFLAICVVAWFLRNSIEQDISAPTEIDLLVCKQINCGKTVFVLYRDDRKIYDNGSLDWIAHAIKNSPSLQKKNSELLIRCSPSIAIIVPFGKSPIYNQALSEDEEEQLFSLLHNETPKVVPPYREPGIVTYG